MERKMEPIQHASHEHPLIFSRKKDGDGKEILCKGCFQKISGSSYSCKNCSFFLHIFCAKLPVEIKHPLHPEHPLSLLLLRFYEMYLECDACGKNLKAFNYHCSICNFKLDLVCASRALNVEHESHKHPLIPQFNPASFECYACGTKDEDVSYKCNTCGFWIHEECASLPNTMKHSGHVHPLTLSYGVSSMWFFCKVCGQSPGKGWFYHCRGCQYVVHPKCIKEESKLVVDTGDIDGSNSIHLPMRDESVSLHDMFVKQICLGDNKEEAKLNHFSHSHTLIFFNVPGDDNLCHGNEPYRCSACDRTISASFYGCRPCNFFLHKWCAKLPDELKHQFHSHPLMLHKEIYDPGRKFFCNNCHNTCKGFSFRCVKPGCQNFFYLDVKCASLPSSIVHEIHEHPLLLKTDCLIEGCAACDRRSYIISFGCGTCHFSLHYNCALLPPIFRHRYDEHPFILNYNPIKDGPDEYICEFCEDEIDPKWWFYHCIDCDQSVCADCILKYGKHLEKSIWDQLLI